MLRGSTLSQGDSTDAPARCTTQSMSAMAFFHRRDVADIGGYDLLGLCARGEMRSVVPAHWSRLNVIDGEAAVLGRDGSVPVSIELSRRGERCTIKGTSFDRTINHPRHGPDVGTILCNIS